MADVEHNETPEGGEEPDQTPDKNEGEVAETTDLANEDTPGDDEPKDNEANDTAEAGDDAGEPATGADDDEGPKPEESADAAEEGAQPEGGDEKEEGGDVEAGGDGTVEVEENPTEEQPEDDAGKNDEPAENDAGEPEDAEDKKVDDVVEVEADVTKEETSPADEDDKEETTEEADEEKAEETNVQAPKELSEETKQRIQQIFERQAANGRLDLKGFKLIFRLMGQVVSSTEAEQMYEDGDRDDNGTIDLDEFLKLYAKYSQEEGERKAALRESIDKLFPDENLRLKKVEQLLMNVNSTIIREKSDLGTNDIRLLVKSMDTDGNGIISKQELVDTLCKHYEV